MLRSNIKQFNCRKLYKSTQAIICFIALLSFLMPQNIGAISIPKETTYTSIPNSYGDYWSADIYGNNVVYTGTDGDIYLYNTSSLQTTRITNTADYEYEPHIYGNNIVFVRSLPIGDNIFLYNLLSGTETQITNSSTTQWMPDIYQDTVVWNNNEHGKAEIYSYNIATQTTMPISTSNSRSEEPSVWGDIVTWYGYGPVYGDSWDIYYCRYRNNAGFSDACKSDGTESTKASSSDSGKSEPSTDGNLILWSDYLVAGHGDIHQYNIATKEEKILTSTSYGESSPKIYNGNIVWANEATKDLYFYNSNLGKSVLASSNLVPSAIYGDMVIGENNTGGLAVTTYDWLNRPDYTLSEKPYSWDGVSTPTGSNSADEGHQIVDLPWSFPFYENTYDKVTFNANGWIALSDTAEDNYNVDLSNPPAPIIAVWNEDLDSSNQANHPYAYSYQVKTDRVVFQWYTETYKESGTDKPNLFEAVLYKDGTIKYDYNYFQSDCGILSPDKEGISPSVSGSGSTLGQVIFDGTVDAFPNVCDASLAQRSFAFSLAGNQENPTNDPPPISDTEVPAPTVVITNPVTMPKTGLSIADYFRYLINLVF